MNLILYGVYQKLNKFRSMMIKNTKRGGGESKEGRGREREGGRGGGGFVITSSYHHISLYELNIIRRIPKIV